MFDLPFRQPPSLRPDLDRCAVYAEWLCAHGFLRHLEGTTFLVDHQRIIPRSCWIDLPVGGRSSLLALVPALTNFERVDKWSALDGDRLVVPGRIAYLHRETQAESVTGFPFPVQRVELARPDAAEGGAIDGHCRFVCPGGDAQFQGELRRLGWVYGEIDSLAEGILGFLGNL